MAVSGLARPGPIGGLHHFDGSDWTQYGEGEGLGGNQVDRIIQAKDGTLWFGKSQGLVRFDWTNWALYPKTQIPISLGVGMEDIVGTPDGALWLRSPHTGDVARFLPDPNPPETSLEPTPDRVTSWDDTPAELVRYQWRIDDEAWSSASRRSAVAFTSLSTGDHRFEVRTIGRDGNVDPTPAIHAFIVEAPWWRNPVVAGPGVLLILGILFQSARVVQAKRKLQDSVNALSSANNELFQVNVDLQREQVLEWLRGQAQGMQSSEDIGPVVEAVHRELTGLGLPLINSGFSITISETKAERWTTDVDGRALEPFVVDLEGVVARPVLEARRRGDDYYHYHVEGEEAEEAIRQQIERGNPHWKGVPEKQWPPKYDAYIVFFVGGSVVVMSEEPVAEEYLMLIKRFGEVFGYAHSRWEELKQKEAQNRRLAVEASVQRLRAEVQSMDAAGDFEEILGLLTEDLKSIGLEFESCDIDVLDEPVESPTMTLFESNGFRYTTFTLDPNGHVTSESFAVAAPFPAVNRQTIERFIAGEPWQAVIEEETTILEVPAGSYGRLRLTASGRERYTDDEIATLREFADAVALGYARYLDIREIQEQTERKSAFLASMSHELRTPMNAIKGFTNLVLNREGDKLSERGQGNLQKATQASDHLLAMIDDLLDLSK